MNILSVIVLGVFLVFAASGWRRGLVKKLAGIVSLLLSFFLVSAALPYITEFIKTETPIYELVVQQCQSMMGQQVTSSLQTQGENGTVINRKEIKSLLEQYGMDSSGVDAMSEEELQALAAQYFQQYLDAAPDQSSGNSGLGLTKIEQTKLIENLPLPDFLKESMLNYNNSEGYSKLNVEDFSGYLVHFLANIVLNILAFVAALLIAQLVLWTGITALDLFARLPILNFINRLGGLAVGLLQGLFVVWLIFLIISTFSGTEWGIQLMEMVNDSTVLQPMYQNNLFLKIVLEAISGLI